MFRLRRSSGQVNVTILSGLGEVELEILGSDMTVEFAAVFECVSMVVHSRRPSKLAPHVEISLAGSSLDVCAFHLGGPPNYPCEFIGVKINRA